MATTATETATKPSSHELVQQMDPARNPKSPKKLKLKRTPPRGNLNSKKGNLRLSEMNSNGLKEMGKEKGSRRNEPPSHLFPYCKAAKDFPTVTQYKTSVQSI
jgi:hypothetical protein